MSALLQPLAVSRVAREKRSQTEWNQSVEQSDETCNYIPAFERAPSAERIIGGTTFVTAGKAVAFRHR